jgi:L-fuconolactonase
MPDMPSSPARDAEQRQAGVIDAHHHLWDLSAHRQPWLESQPELAPLLRDFTLADLEPLARGAAVSGTVVVQTVCEPGETPELLAVAAGSDLIAGVVGWADLTSPDAADLVSALGELPGAAKLAGIRHPVLAEAADDWLQRPDVLRGLAAVAAAGLPYDIVARPGQLPAAVAAATALPQLTFVLDHLGNPDISGHVNPAWASDVRRLAALPNTICKLSGILGAPAPPPGGGPAGVAHLRPYYQLVLDGFGPDRLMYGSDWPVSTLGSSYVGVLTAARQLTAQLTAAEQDAIFAATARRVYRLGEPAAPGR